MSESQPAAEITTRDVLLPIDHRLSLIETDVRESNTKICRITQQLLNGRMVGASRPSQRLYQQ